jgi:proteasome alpha subunit
MFEEPYRWVEAIANRREYLEEQLIAGSPVVALPCREGILILTLSTGTQKLYEIYDRIVMGAIGHPADVERLRNMALDMAHIEGFNRSPADVTARRLVQFGLGPPVKQAFEEVTHAPFIIRLLIAELDHAGRRTFLTLNFDGIFNEESIGALLAPSSEAGVRMESEFKKISNPADRPLREIFPSALKIWGAGEKPSEEVDAFLRQAIKERTIEAGLLSESVSGHSKYRPLPSDEVAELTRSWRDS